jgi:3-deoxy-D-manno-octulosonate 8-phosphate phosphatase (KDO 8-P phosphatase)
VQNKLITLENIDAFIFDFDGVLTNNLVFVDQDGKESVSCNRSDGLAFDVLRKLKKPSYILSTEKNPIVSARAKKLKIQAIQGVEDKVQELLILAKTNEYNLNRVLYVGNDINDYKVMKLCGYSACPSDSHEKIRSIATFVLQKKGGNGVIRELLEVKLNIDFIKTLYS